MEKYKYTSFCAFSLLVLYLINVKNYYYIKNDVMHPDAVKVTKLKPKKVDLVFEEI
jgi:hypothetical protein